MYAVARRIWGITRFIWTVIIIGILIGLSANILSGKLEDFYKATVLSFGKWLLGPEIYQRLALFAIVLFIFISISSGLITFFAKKPQQDEAAKPLAQEIQPVIHQLQTISNQLQTITEYLRDDLKARRESEVREQGARNEQRGTEEILQALIENLATETPYSDRLHHNLLFALSTVADGGTWSMGKAIQQKIANRIFDLYSDPLGLGRYFQQQQEIKERVLYWVNAQLQVSGKEESTPPLVESWRTALCDASKPARQEGSVRLLAELAPDLSNRVLSLLVLRNFIPPLLQLADILDLDSHYPGAVRQNLPQPPARAASLRVEEYAFIALRRFDTYGPPNWLHNKWLEWNQNQPELSERLTMHSREIHYLMTPAALPIKPDSPNWTVQRKVGNTWQQLNQQYSSHLQTQLLNASDTARYPHAYLLHQLLESESLSSTTLPWHITWDTLLQQEMERGRSATYPACLGLRLLLSRVIEQQPQKLAGELEASLLSLDRRQTQASIAIAQLYWQNARIAPELQDMLETRKLLDYLNTRDIIDMQDLQTPNNMRYTEYLLSLRSALDSKKMAESLCSLLEKARDTPDSVLLFTFYCFIAFGEFLSLQFMKRVQSLLQSVMQRQGQHMPGNQRLLIEAAQRQVNESIMRFDSSR